jgi:hypothetical protein
MKGRKFKERPSCPCLEVVFVPCAPPGATPWLSEMPPPATTATMGLRQRAGDYSPYYARETPRVLQRADGCNTLHGRYDPADRVYNDNHNSDDKGNAFFKCTAGVVATVLQAFCDQLWEPLILMVLFLEGCPCAWGTRPTRCP